MISTSAVGGAGIAAAPMPSLTPLQQASRDLVVSLRAQDLQGARQAYADIVRNRPEGSTWQPGSEFAQLGKALVQGDIEAAKTLVVDAIKGRIPASPGPEPAPKPAPAGLAVPSTTGGASGQVINVVA